VLQNLNFYGGTHTILPSSLHVLMALLETMKRNPNLVIAVEGHICCTPGTEDGFDIGTQTKNLSENRAREVCLYLAKNGIAQHRLHYKGFGHSQPLYLYPEQNEQERINNRRVEIKILKK
jgi:outer membrane protein OmpA-like peptidoglycan-associated protein